MGGADAESMARLTPHFSTNRSVREYTEQYYLPIASAYRARTADKGVIGTNIIDWQHALNQKWVALRFGEVKIETVRDQYVFKIQVYLDDLDPDAVQVELYANGINGATPERLKMERLGQLTGSVGGYIYSVSVPAIRTESDYTARVVPQHENAAVPLEAPWILWQK